MKKQQEAECPKEKEANKTFKPKSEPLIPEKAKLQVKAREVKEVEVEKNYRLIDNWLDVVWLIDSEYDLF